jgi:hypothetical protein
MEKLQIRLEIQQGWCLQNFKVGAFQISRSVLSKFQGQSTVADLL